MRKDLISSLIAVVALFLGGCFPSFDPEAEEHFRQGLEYERQSVHDLAKEEFTRAIELDPEYYFAYYNRALVYYRLGDLERSLGDYSKAIDLQGDNAYWVFERGLLYWEYRDGDKAISDLERAIELGLPRDYRQRAEEALELLRQWGPQSPPDLCSACPG